ncbi:MAG: glycosyltransferase, partial [Desulfobacterales bacterium]|nr:glycosyltransferase [Desulfobacterales bacterium]
CRAAELLPDTRYTLIGDGPDAEKAQAELDRCRQGLPVRIAGRINPPDMPDELKRHHCVALLSDYEGMPLALMEAMAHGLVPISLKHCIGAAELIQDGINGLLIDDAEKDLPQAVSLLKNDPELFKSLSMAARERIRTVSELGIVTEKWFALFNSIKDAEGPRCPVRNPVRLNLPPCNSKVACEDDRGLFMGGMNALVKSGLPFFIHGENTQFLSPQCLPSTVDTYTVRIGILRALEQALPLFSGMVVDVGAGSAPYKPIMLEAIGVTGYLALDLAGSAYASPDIFWDGKRLPLADGSVGTVMATEVLEHCPVPEALLSETQRVLSPGGLFFGTVPFLWPVHDVPHDHWRYTPWALTRLLEEAGFTDIHITATGGYEAAMAQMIGLWVRRRSRSKFYQYFLRPVLSALSVPLVWGLMRMDKGADEFREGLMVTGFSIMAKKEKLA